MFRVVKVKSNFGSDEIPKAEEKKKELDIDYIEYVYKNKELYMKNEAEKIKQMSNIKQEEIYYDKDTGRWKVRVKPDN
jgi:hypothetical protein